MNIFTTIPAGFKVIAELKRYNKLAPEVDSLLEAGRAEDARELMRKGMTAFADNVIRELKLDYTVEGSENIPEDGPLLIMSNHQGYADILALYHGIQNFHFGMVAKKEFANVKMMKVAIEHTGSLFIDRGNPRAAVQTIRDARAHFAAGDSLGIFPEGTRSRGYKMGEFKAGSFKFAEKGKVPILPVSISGSYHIIEETGSFHRTPQLIRIHPLVHYEQLSRSEHHDAQIAIEDTIRNGIEDI